MTPYYADEAVQLYLGDMRDVLPALGIQADAAIVDPPYGETTLAWDRWPDGWPSLVAKHTRSMWCFGSMRMFLDRWGEFANWKLSQDVVWEKHNGSGFAADRFRRVHENALHFYRGEWRDVHHVVPRVPATYDTRRRKGAVVVAQDSRPAHTGATGAHVYVEEAIRLTRSVIYAKSTHRRAIHPTEKPTEIIAPLIEYAVPPGGLVLDPFAGSGSTLLTARMLGRRAVGIEANEAYCEVAGKRLATPDLFGGVA